MFYVSVYYPISNRMCIVLCSPERNAKIRIRAQITQPIALSLSLFRYFSLFFFLSSPLQFFSLDLSYSFSVCTLLYPVLPVADRRKTHFTGNLCVREKMSSLLRSNRSKVSFFIVKDVFLCEMSKKRKLVKSLSLTFSSYCKVRDSMCLSVKSMGERVSNREDESWAVGSLRTQVEQVLCVLSSHTSQIEVIMTFVFLSRSE